MGIRGEENTGLGKWRKYIQSLMTIHETATGIIKNFEMRIFKALGKIKYDQKSSRQRENWDKV